MTDYCHISTWMAGARSEAILSRHTQIEQTDLLLGLLAQGGAVAQLLGAQGVSLARARQGLAELDDADLAQVGIHVPQGLRPPRLEADHAIVAKHADLPWSPGAEAIVFERRGKVRTDLQALQVMLGAEESDVVRLLAHLGVDLERVRAHLRQTSPQPAAVDRVPVPLAYHQEGIDTALRCQRFVSAPDDLVRRVLSDPTHLGKWLVAGAQVLRSDAGGAWTQHGRGRRSMVLHHRLAGVPGGQVVWRSEIDSGRRRGQLLAARSLELTPAPGGTLVGLTLLTRSFGVTGKMLRPVTRMWAPFGLRHQLATIAPLIADRCLT